MAVTSIHIRPVKGGSEAHNFRTKKLGYVREDLTPNNEHWSIDTISERRADIEQRYLSSVGQKMQAKATPIREGVVVIQEARPCSSSRSSAPGARKNSASRQSKFTYTVTKDTISIRHTWKAGSQTCMPI